MLQIRLSKAPSSDGGGAAKPLPAETVTVACPDHLVLADLPVAKGIGAATAASLVKTVGRRSRRQLGERVHFCVRCDFPIAIYGRLNPCEHVFCLDCARSDSICYLCDDRIQKIQTIKMMESIFICAAPHCLKSFLKKTEFESHIHNSHGDLLQPNAEKEEGNESESLSAKQPTVSDSSVRAPPRQVISPGSNSQLSDREDKARRQQSREQPAPRTVMPPKAPVFGQVQIYQSDTQPENNLPPGFERPGPYNRFNQGFDAQGVPQQESSHQQGLVSESPFPEYPPVHSMQPPNFVVPMNSNPMMIPPFSVPPFPTEGSQQFYGAPYGMPRPDLAPEIGSEQASLLGFPQGPTGGVNFPGSYPQPWNTGPTGMPFEVPSVGQGIPDGFGNMSDSQSKAAFYQGYAQNPGGLRMIPPLPTANKGMEASQGSNAIDPRDSKGILTSPQMSLPPPPPPPPPGPPPQSHLPLHKQGMYYSGDMVHDGQGFGWPYESRDSYANSQD
ncbi:E3 ubiquitin-protein ligase HAKAI homolog [Mangifera indica]|uniref:E3 ubiquitin-protein ligase HAKAI homolog n=1 Tax=Mangifera indica TaxID=29780 RepID=UPI001CFA9524|nr:E3 ubiquitin-protein ligase HAKAI homolog [Mangifera indica]XP_044474332.1 E3 ubiquitin-protein ligase HAKAI homolog [Mangifera indica]XP_044474333.1 E3 ubiquitin-protein ligase HAKAI homolog [Mangifera indica]XP_044474334.1 E3 ubiquitin-protein ligase HAKAI homolog [Mangifera indica]XP_044474336.1 E3 ubiquitin-protein ligase HAKAI homolog [Mangifera indica]XP_044474337.1 E3 ubiquitin-protein ligase HAKAI homolog [Mangifera indica]